MNPPSRTHRSPRPGLAALLAAVVTAISAPAADVPEAVAAPVTAELAYRETPHSFFNVSVSTSRESKPFAKEPPVSANGVLRGTLNLGGKGTNALAFLWDHRVGRLFLDLNRNLDLTHDTHGAFTSQKGWSVSANDGAQASAPASDGSVSPPGLSSHRDGA